MHPLLRDVRSLLAYLVAWIPIGAGLILLVSPQPLSWTQGTAVVIPLCIVYAFVCLSGLYVYRAFPLTPAKVRRSILQQATHAAVAGLLCLVVAKAAAAISAIPPSHINAALPVIFGFGVLLFLLSIAIHWAFFSIQARESAEKRAGEAKLMASQAELRALRSQINPHFLYNSLNSISALTSVDPGKARQMCIQLSEFLRSTLGLSDQEKIPLRSEMDLVRRYLDIEKTRFGQRLNFEEDIADECASDTVPALILQPLIENAVIHGIAGMTQDGKLRVVARRRDAKALSLTVENSFDSETPPAKRHGFGLKSIRKRLETEYGGQASLSTSAEVDLFRAELVLPVVQERL
jgi:hypothetical protein